MVDRIVTETASETASESATDLGAGDTASATPAGGTSPSDSSSPPNPSLPRDPSSRRRFLTTAGLGVLTVAVGAAVTGDVYAARRGVFSSGTGAAYQPWQDWQLGSAPERLVRAAILAANAHNAQAWRFAVTPRRIDLYDDTTRSLGAVDPYRRELHLSAGCAIENLSLAAAAGGFSAAVTLRPTADPTLLASVDLTPAGAVSSPLYRAIPHRHTDRAAYRSGTVLPAGVLRGMDALVDATDVRLHWLTTVAERATFSTATVAATQAFIADPRQSADDYSWYRGTWSQVQDHRDGVTVDASGLTPLLGALGKMVPATQASNDQYWLTGTRDRQLPTAAAFGLLLVADPGDVVQRLAAGRLYQRLHLWATTQGLAMQPLNQLVERAERERSTAGPGPAAAALAGLVADDSWSPVMPFRVGYPTAAAPASPRRALGDVLVSTR